MRSLRLVRPAQFDIASSRVYESTDQSFNCLQSFSSVVGPNGSGKSNVIDAMLFVFGKKAKQVAQLFLSVLA